MDGMMGDTVLPMGALFPVADSRGRRLEGHRAIPKYRTESGMTEQQLHGL
jgi:hypothetical protein